MKGLYQTLTKRNPFRGTLLAWQAARHQEEAAERLRRFTEDWSEPKKREVEDITSRRRFGA